jgi:hypothetical protein
MKWRSPFAVVVLVMMSVALVMAKPYVRLTQPPPGQHYLYQIWKLTLTNPDPDSYRVQMKGTITEAQQGVTLQHNTTKRLKYGDPELAMAPGYPTYASGYEDFAYSTGGLPPGHYTFTVWLLPDFGSSSDTFTVRPMGPPRLIMPRDGDTVRTPYPQFVWTSPMPRPTGGVTYELKLFEVMPGQTPEEALRANPPWFMKVGITATSLTYPTSARELQVRAGIRFDYLDELRADGIIRNADGKLGFEVTWTEDKLELRYTSGVAYVGGCRYEIEGGSVAPNESASGKVLLVCKEGDRGLVKLVYNEPLPARYAMIAEFSTSRGGVVRVVDRRFDLTHLDEQVRANTQAIAARRADRRQFVPLLASTLPNLRYRDGRNYAWQVSAFVGGTKVGESETWSFVVPAGGSGSATSPRVTSREVIVYPHTLQELYRYQAGADETLGVWFSPPSRTRPFKAVSFVAGDSATWDTVRGCVRLVPKYPQGGQPLSTSGTLLKEFTFQTGAKGTTTAVVFNPPLATDPERDFLVCWASQRMARGWPTDTTSSWTPPRSYRLHGIEKPWGEPEPLAGDLAVVAVFTSIETVDVQVDAINAPTGQVLLGTTMTPQAVVRNNGTQPADFPVRLRIGAAYMDSVLVSNLGPGSATSVSFSPWTATQAGTFQVRCTTCLPGDLVSTNNLRVDSVVVVPPDTGGFSIELIWKDGRADLDLYLVLPNRQGTADTVCWKKRQAQGCMLDVDDTQGYGPEKIRGPIGAMMPDTAKVGVHYYGPANGVSTQANVLFYRNRVLVDSTKWTVLSPGNWWNVGTLDSAFKKFTIDIDPRVEPRPDLSIPRK